MARLIQWKISHSEIRFSGRPYLSWPTLLKGLTGEAIENSSSILWLPEVLHRKSEVSFTRRPITVTSIMLFLRSCLNAAPNWRTWSTASSDISGTQNANIELLFWRWTLNIELWTLNYFCWSSNIEHWTLNVELLLLNLVQIFDSEREKGYILIKG